MGKNIALILFGTFGNPNGFTQSLFVKNFPIKPYDIKPTALQLFETTSKIYALRKEIAGSDSVISFIKYSYASEQGSSRGGTFVGGAVLNANGLADVDLNIQILDKWHSSLIENPANVQDGIIQVKHSKDFKLSQIDTSPLVVNPEAISDIDFAEKGKNLVVYTSLDHIQKTIRQSLDLLNEYDIIYFTQDENVAQYVLRKGLYEVVQEIKGQQELTAKVQALSLAKVEHQKALLNKVINSIKQEQAGWEELVKRQEEAIQKNKQIHQKNAEKISEDEKNLKANSQSFQSHINRLNTLSHKLKGNPLKQLERQQLEKEIDQIQKTLVKERQGFNLPASLRLLPESQKAVGPRPVPSDHQNEKKYPSSHKKADYIPVKYIIVAVIAILALSTVAYLGYQSYKSDKQTQNTAITQVVTKVPIENQEPEKVNLNPFPTGELKPNDAQKTLVKQFPKDLLPMPIDTVVARIFKANPTEIGQPYKGYEREYGTYLIQENPNNFDADKKLKETSGLRIPVYSGSVVGNSEPVQNPEAVSPLPLSTVEDLKKK